MAGTRGVVTRFAPSPTGYMHLGHAFAALQAWHTARQRNGRFLLRIEDIDRDRCREEFEEAILEGEIPNEHDAAYEFMKKIKLT